MENFKDERDNKARLTTSSGRNGTGGGAAEIEGGRPTALVTIADGPSAIGEEIIILCSAGMAALMKMTFRKKLSFRHSFIYIS